MLHLLPMLLNMVFFSLSSSLYCEEGRNLGLAMGRVSPVLEMQRCDREALLGKRKGKEAYGLGQKTMLRTSVCRAVCRHPFSALPLLEWVGPPYNFAL